MVSWVTALVVEVVLVSVNVVLVAMVGCCIVSAPEHTLCWQFLGSAMKVLVLLLVLSVWTHMIAVLSLAMVAGSGG